MFRVKGKGVIEEYLNDDEATQRSFKNGWFYPGDLGKITKDGQLIHLGRADHMMIFDGINIYPAEIEQVITSHPLVMDAAVMPLNSHVHQDIPVCAVVLRKDALEITEKELLDFTYSHLGNRSPHRVIKIEQIPRTVQGKLIRMQLAYEISNKLGLKIIKN